MIRILEWEIEKVSAENKYTDDQISELKRRLSAADSTDLKDIVNNDLNLTPVTGSTTPLEFIETIEPIAVMEIEMYNYTK
jgi:hypothetical protein